ncbi:MAG: hypothetical protein RSA50_05730 [Mucinivorans sp.]
MENELLVKLITKHTRLVLPNFGAFLRKEGAPLEATVFSPFLKQDDQETLCKAIAQEMGLEKEDAQNILQGYIEHIESVLETKGKYYIEQLGLLGMNDNGAISMVTEIPKVVVAEAPVPTPAPAIPHVTQSIETNRFEPPYTRPASRTVVTPARAVVPPITAPRQFTTPQQQRPATQRAGYGEPNRPTGPAPINGGGHTHQNGAPQVAMGQPRPAGQRPTQQPQRPMQGIGGPSQRPMPPQQGARPSAPGAAQRGPQRRTAPRQKASGWSKNDIILIVAIAAALIVIGLMIYGQMVTNPTIELTPEHIENMAPSTTTTPEVATPPSK